MTTSPPTPFFVLGHPRSGTTALARLLNASERAACIFYEGNLLYRLHRILARHRVLEEPHIDLITDFEVTARHNLIDKPGRSGICKPVFNKAAVASMVKGFAGDLERIQDTPALFNSTAQRFFRLFSGNGNFYAVGDKVPDYINIPDALHTAVPGAKLLYIKRDPRASVHSALRFGKDGLHLFAAPDALAMGFAWILRHLGMEKFAHRIDPGHLLALQQENLMTDPLSVAEKSAEFLGFSVDGPIKKHIEAASQRLNIKNWYTEMAPEDISAVESAICEAGLGREISDPSPGPTGNSWSEKAASLAPLIGCRNEAVPGVVQTARDCFRGKYASETLGQALVQFADWAHLKTDDDRAGLLYREAVRLLPKNPVLGFKYGEFCFDIKHLEAAKSLFQDAMETCPDTDYFRFLKAKALYLLGRTDRLSGKRYSAENFFKESLEIFKDFELPKAMLKAMAGS